MITRSSKNLEETPETHGLTSTVQITPFIDRKSKRSISALLSLALLACALMAAMPGFAFSSSDSAPSITCHDTRMLHSEYLANPEPSDLPSIQSSVCSGEFLVSEYNEDWSTPLILLDHGLWQTYWLHSSPQLSPLVSTAFSPPFKPSLRSHLRIGRIHI